MCIYMFVHVNVVLMVVREGVWVFRNWSYRWSWASWSGCWEPNTGPRDELHMLFTAVPSLQLLSLFSRYCCVNQYMLLLFNLVFKTNYEVFMPSIETIQLFLNVIKYIILAYFWSLFASASPTNISTIGLYNVAIVPNRHSVPTKGSPVSLLQTTSCHHSTLHV